MPPKTLALVVLATCGALAAAPPTVRDGQLWRDGTPYRAVGVNYCDLFQEVLGNPDSDRTLRGLRYLGERKIPFVRFWCCGFWPSDWKLYFENKEEYFRRLDLVVRAAEEANVGLIPSLFWRVATFPDLMDEFTEDWAKPESKTRAFMANYVKEVVTRYRESPAIWGWEFANEVNLAVDLPNGMNFLGKKMPDRGVDLAKDTRNLMTKDIAQAAFVAFASEVRKYDKVRFITSGNSNLRESQYNQTMHNTWTKDTAEEAAQAFAWLNPDPINVTSIHLYPGLGKAPSYAGAEGTTAIIGLYKSWSRRLGKPLFLGEFASLGHDKGKTIDMDVYKRVENEILAAVVTHKVDLAAHWVFDYTKDRKGSGLIRPDNKWAWILDEIVRTNKAIQAQLAAEGKAADPKP
jgi:hypothetical protein